MMFFFTYGCLVRDDLIKKFKQTNIMCAIASQITSLMSVYSTVYSGADQRKHQRSASLAFVRGIHRWPVSSPHKRPVTRKMFLFDDVLMITFQSGMKYITLSTFVWRMSCVTNLSCVTEVMCDRCQVLRMSCVTNLSCVTDVMCDGCQMWRMSCVKDVTLYTQFGRCYIWVSRACHK